MSILARSTRANLLQKQHRILKRLREAQARLVWRLLCKNLPLSLPQGEFPGTSLPTPVPERITAPGGSCRPPTTGTQPTPVTRLNPRPASTPATYEAQTRFTSLSPTDGRNRPNAANPAPTLTSRARSSHGSGAPHLPRGPATGSGGTTTPFPVRGKPRCRAPHRGTYRDPRDSPPPPPRSTRRRAPGRPHSPRAGRSVRKDQSAPEGRGLALRPLFPPPSRGLCGEEPPARLPSGNVPFGGTLSALENRSASLGWWEQGAGRTGNGGGGGERLPHRGGSGAEERPFRSRAKSHVRARRLSPAGQRLGGEAPWAQQCPGPVWFHLAGSGPRAEGKHPACPAARRGVGEPTPAHPGQTALTVSGTVAVVFESRRAPARP